MNKVYSEYFNRFAIKGLDKVGDVIIPGTTGENGFPSFSQTGCIENVDEILQVTHPEDVAALNILMTVLGLLPALVTLTLFKLSMQDEKVPDILGNPLRMLNLALRGLPMSLYYSSFSKLEYDGKKVYEIIDYDIYCEPDPDFKNF